MLSYLIWGLILWVFIIRPLLRWLDAPGEPTDEEAQYVLIGIYKVAGAVANAHGDESKEEIDAVVQIVRMAFSAPDMPAEKIREGYFRYSKTPLTRADAAKLSPKLRIVLLQVAISVAASDHEIHANELKRIYEIAQTMDIPKAVVDQLLSQVGGSKQTGTRTGARGQVLSAVDYAYQVMELEQNASWAEVKKQYRRLAMRWHPDKAPEEEKAEATQKFKELGDAFSILKERYGKA